MRRLIPTAIKTKAQSAQNQRGPGIKKVMNSTAIPGHTGAIAHGQFGSAVIKRVFKGRPKRGK